jgi:hypothetical protein
MGFGVNMKTAEEIAAEKNARERDQLIEARIDRLAKGIQEMADLDMEEITTDDESGQKLQGEYESHCHADLQREMAEAERKKPSPEEVRKMLDGDA